MAFKKICVNEIIEQNKQTDSEFAEAWDKSRMEYRIIGEIIRLRKQQGISQTELASRIKKKQQTVSRVENKEVNPSLKLICNMVDTMGYELKIVPKN